MTIPVDVQAWRLVVPFEIVRPFAPLMRPDAVTAAAASAPCRVDAPETFSDPHWRAPVSSSEAHCKAPEKIALEPLRTPVTLSAPWRTEAPETFMEAH